MLSLAIETLHWPLREPFKISRETMTQISCIQATLRDEIGHVGRGEGVGIQYEGETPASMMAQIEAVRDEIELGLTRNKLQKLLPHGGARNAIDCALWDLEAKASNIPAWRSSGLNSFQPCPTAYTLPIMDEAKLRLMAKRFSDFPLLKIKTDRERGLDPVRIVNEVAPNARLIVDPNQSWGDAELIRFTRHFESLNVVLLEQPVAITDDDMLHDLSLNVPIAADEAFTQASDLHALIGKYQVLNIKLDKTGGLTEALLCARKGIQAGFSIMVGCMIGSSLSMAPGMVVAQLCDYVDLDGPLLQAEDVDHPITYDKGIIMPPTSQLWG